MARLGTIRHNINRVWDESKVLRDWRGRFATKGSKKRRGSPEGERMNPAAPYSPYSGDKSPDERFTDLGVLVIGGVETVPKELAHLVADGLERAKAMGGNLPKFFLFDDNKADENGDAGVASYTPMFDMMTIYSDDSYWKDPWNQAAYQRDTGFWATDNPLNPVYHEIGHKTHRDLRGTKGLRRAKAEQPSPLVENKVSEYAMTNGAEFVAETYAGLLYGKTYPPEVMEEYRRFGGPRVL
ncbi:MAG: hypothetical protein M3P49_12815 [Actinomycetota bacterium]|nr:hypothetical protein [Actinomycetota bacterium]